MNTCMENFLNYLSKRPVKYGFDDVSSLLELLTHCYLEENPIENAVIHYKLQKVNDILSRMTVQENDALFLLICELCDTYTHRAFSEGLHTGIQLAIELWKDINE